MRIAIANSSRQTIDLIRQVLAPIPAHRVIWESENGIDTVGKCLADRPDLLLLDVVMPDMSGVEVTRRIMGESPCSILIVTATVDAHAARIFEAMRWGAIDVAPAPGFENGAITGGSALAHKISIVQKLLGKTPDVPTATQPKPVQRVSVPLVAIGSSTGGPKALATILSGLPCHFGAAVAIVQHIDAQFTLGLAEWLGGQTELKVALAREGDVLTKGHVLVAQGPGDLVLTPERTLSYRTDDLASPYHPSVSLFFQSCAANLPEPGIAVLLSGMGKDGVSGMLALRKAGWTTIAQDEATSVIYGMPKAAVKEKAATLVLPVGEIAPALLKRFGTSPT